MKKIQFITDNAQQTAINEMTNNTPLRVIKLKAETNDKVFNSLLNYPVYSCILKTGQSLRIF